MIKKRSMHLGMVMTVISTGLTGCSSTEITKPPKGYEEIGETITFTIACPEAAKLTRADNDHVLRFTAIAYNGNSVEGSEFVERQEVIASNDGTETVTFKVPEGKYTFLIIGDYIPTANVAKKDANGHYPDAYYNTTLDDGRIYMRSFYDFKTETTVSTNCLNNDNYDCFGKTRTITKTADKVEENISLPRIVSKINVVSTSSAISEIKNITFKYLDFWGHHNFITQEAGTYAGNKLSAIQSISCNALHNNPYEVLFFFYTLAPLTAGETLGSIEFNVNYANGSVFTSTIPDRKIKPIANYQITVQGAFLSEPVVETGDIILHLSSSEDWNNP